jgi:hypothetical protein
MSTYFTQYITALQMLSGRNAILILEPITMGFCAERAYTYPATCLPSMEFVYVKGSGVSQVSGYADNVVGLFQALVGLAHSIAPDATVGIYFMIWALKTSSSSQELVYWPKADRDANITEWNKFLAQLNIMSNVDFVSLGKNRYDAGYSGVGSDCYWPAAQFANFLDYSAGVRKTFAKPLVGWYLPIGHRGLPNSAGRYEDVFAEYFFANSQSFTDAGYCGMLFGKYDSNGTELSETAGIGDDGWFINQLKLWRAK